MKQLSNSIASQTFLPIEIAISLSEQSHSQSRQKAPSPQPIPVSYQRPFKLQMAQETDSFSLMSCQKQKGRKKRNGDDILERGETTPILDSSEKTIDLDKRLRNISKLLPLGVFLEPVLDFRGFHLIHSLFNGALIPVSRVDLQKKAQLQREGASYSSCCLSTRSYICSTQRLT